MRPLLIGYLLAFSQAVGSGAYRQDVFPLTVVDLPAPYLASTTEWNTTRVINTTSLANVTRAANVTITPRAGNTSVVGNTTAAAARTYTSLRNVTSVITVVTGSNVTTAHESVAIHGNSQNDIPPVFSPRTIPTGPDVCPTLLCAAEVRTASDIFAAYSDSSGAAGGRSRFLGVEYLEVRAVRALVPNNATIPPALGARRATYVGCRAYPAPDVGFGSTHGVGEAFLACSGRASYEGKLYFGLYLTSAQAVGYASRAVQFHPNEGQFDVARTSARTSHGADVQMSWRNQEGQIPTRKLLPPYPVSRCAVFANVADLPAPVAEAECSAARTPAGRRLGSEVVYPRPNAPEDVRRRGLAVYAQPAPPVFGGCYASTAAANTGKSFVDGCRETAARAGLPYFGLTQDAGYVAADEELVGLNCAVNGAGACSTAQGSLEACRQRCAATPTCTMYEWSQREGRCCLEACVRVLRTTRARP